METVTVLKLDLLEIVQKNRDAHHAQWKQAFEGYRTACIQALETNLAALRERRAQRVIFTEVAPEDHTRDYDRVLKMLGMSTDDKITLSAQDFAKYVEDDWSWKHVWRASNSKYLGGD